MALAIEPLHPRFAAEIVGVDLRKPLEPAVLAKISAALGRFAVLVFRSQFLSDDQQIAFSATFGRLETAVGSMNKQHRLRLDRTSIADVSNLDSDDRIREAADPWRLFQRANQFWHTDSSFKPVPGKYSFLSAHETPPDGGETEFADMRAAYDALPAATKARIAGLTARHSMQHSRKLAGFADFSEEQRTAMPPVSRPLVRVHAESGRPALYLAAHASHIDGWSVEDGQALLAELMAFATQPQFVHQHRWRVGDLVIWDNSCTMHRGLAYDDLRWRRDLRRTTTEDAAFGHAPARVFACPEATA
jgi:alpha-ketoglutarate-dependent 2,4-dichlorophenoxyacetate dioxygenase